MNEFVRHICRAAHICKGGIYCPYDRPNPTSSAGARRLAASKVRSRRNARAVLRAEAAREIRQHTDR